MADKRLRNRQRDLDNAPDYESWREIAAELDRLEGLEDWRADDTSDDYDYLLIKERLAEIRSLRQAGAWRSRTGPPPRVPRRWLRWWLGSS